MTAGKRKRERPRKHAIGKATLDERKIRFANVSTSTAERIAETRACGGVLCDKQASACLEIKSMNKPRLFEPRKFRPRGTQPRFDARRVTLPLRNRMDAGGLCDDEPRRLLVEDRNRGGGVLRGHRRTATVPNMRVTLLAVIASLASLLVASRLGAEKMPTPKFLLRHEPVVLDVTVLSIEEKPGPHAGSSVWHRVRIDHVERGEGLKAGDEAAVVSRTYRLAPGTAGTTGHRGFGNWRGPNGLPAKGDRARLFASGSSVLQPHFTNGWQAIEPVVAFVAADDEYRSEITMPFLSEIVAAPLGVKTTTHLATDQGFDAGGEPTPNVAAKTNLTGSTALGNADAIVVYMRFEQLDRGTLDRFLQPLQYGVPLVAFRTSTHAFAYPEGHPQASLNNGFGEKYLGTPWRFHHGHTSKTRILPPSAEAAKHPMLEGVTIPAEGLVVPSWLYHVEPLPADCRVLLWGEAIDSEREVGSQNDAPQKQPILWVRERQPDMRASRDPKETPKSEPPTQRIAVTTLGHPGDFANPEFRLIAAQMVAWALHRNAELSPEERAMIRATAFDAPPTR